MNRLKHGDHKTKLYSVWGNMKDRCLNLNCKCYKYYGGRGIDVCESWRTDFISFRDWAVNNGYKEGLSIDRINNNKGYHPDNCKWSTNREQILSGILDCEEVYIIRCDEKNANKWINKLKKMEIAVSVKEIEISLKKIKKLNKLYWSE